MIQRSASRKIERRVNQEPPWADKERETEPPGKSISKEQKEPPHIYKMEWLSLWRHARAHKHTHTQTNTQIDRLLTKEPLPSQPDYLISLQPAVFARLFVRT